MTVNKKGLPKKPTLTRPTIPSKPVALKNAPSRSVLEQMDELNGVLSATNNTKTGTPTPRMVRPSRPSTLKRMESIREVNEVEDDSDPSTPDLPLSEREKLILELIAENMRLTPTDIAIYLLWLEGRPEADLARMMESLRKGNFAKLLRNGCVKKIVPTRGTSAFFIATEHGMNHLDTELPLEREMLRADFNAKNLNAGEHSEIMNIASVVLQFKMGRIVLEDYTGESNNRKTFRPGPQCVVTEAEILSSLLSIDKSAHPSLFHLQKQASETFVNLKESPETSALPLVDGRSFHLQQGTHQSAEELRTRMRRSFDVSTQADDGTESPTLMNPLFLFTSFTSQGELEPSPLMEFVIIQDNVLATSLWTGELVPAPTHIAVKVETNLKSPEQIQDELWRIFRAPHKPINCYIISRSVNIKVSFNNAWKKVMSNKKVPGKYSDWLRFGTHEPLNSPNKEATKHYSRPTPGRLARTWIDG